MYVTCRISRESGNFSNSISIIICQTPAVNQATVPSSSSQGLVCWVESSKKGKI